MLVHGALSLWSASRESATFDECAHLGAGYAHLVLNDWRFDLTQGPLTKLMAAAAVRGLDPPVPVDTAAWRDGNYFSFGHDFVYGSGMGRRMLQRARMPSVVMGMLLILVIFAWAREAWGLRGGLLAMGLAALNPELLAHSHYVTSDTAVALAFALYLWGFWRFLRRPSAVHGAWVVAAFAFAAMTKFSFLALVPISLLLGGARLLQLVRRGDGPAWRALLKALLWSCAAGVAATVLAAWVACGFQARAVSSPELQPSMMTIERMLPEGAASRAVLVWMRDRAWIPEAYATSLAHTIYTPSVFGRTFLLGHAKQGANRAFFPVALAVKTPLPLLALAIVGCCLRRRSGAADLERAALLVPWAVYFGIAVLYGYSIGYRHLMPVIPVLIVLAGRAAQLSLACRWRALAFKGLLAWQALGTLWVAPHFLSYFNEIAGGPSGGNRWLADSNCDWGQDLDELGRWMRREGVEEVLLSYFGTASIEEAGVNARWLTSVVGGLTITNWAREVKEGDVVAVSVTNLRQTYVLDPAKYPMKVELPGTSGMIGSGYLLTYLDARYEPVGRAGYSILIYRLERQFER